ncbi:MAG: hypothetical protein KGQ81_00390 [Cyanobacteria bacterium REEB498]|nr:hypothetical protein [Cyanobacteria bacterium REEB498]
MIDRLKLVRVAHPDLRVYWSPDGILPLKHPLVRDSDATLDGYFDIWSMPETGLAVLFHTTTEAAADQITRGGFTPATARAGALRFDPPGSGFPRWGRPAPMPGIWAYPRPVIPYVDHEAQVDGDDWVILALTVPHDILHDRCYLDQEERHPWFVPPFCLHPGDVKSIEAVKPEEMTFYLGDLSSGCAHIAECDHDIETAVNPYIRALLGAGATTPCGAAA